MTGTYESNSIPHHLDIKCPKCQGCAEFEFAEIVRINLKSEVEFFQKSSIFEYQQFQDSCGHIWHGALYFEALHGSPNLAIHDLPPGYAPDDWAHSKYLRSRREFPVGALRCSHCGTRAKHELAWPGDAYYSVGHRSQILWAYHRESAVELAQYLSSTARDISKYRWRSFLLHVPTTFKVRKAREAIVKQMSKLLAS